MGKKLARVALAWLAVVVTPQAVAEEFALTRENMVTVVAGEMRCIGEWTGESTLSAPELVSMMSVSSSW